MSERKIPIGISMPPSVLDAIDKARGQIPRSTFVLNVLEEKMKIENRRKASTQ